MAEGLDELMEHVKDKLHDEACTLKMPAPKPKDPTDFSAVDVDKRAKNIMQRGDVLKFFVRQAQRNHIGDTDVIKHLIASICSTNSLTSAGIQPELNGEKGHGKTDAVKAVVHLIPDKWKLSATITATALYYHLGLPTGAIIFSDDVEWSPALIATVKRSMGDFQNPQEKMNVDIQRHSLPQMMPARLVWWLSSVESVADDQLKDRQYSLDIDEGSDHMSEVSNYLRQSRSKKVVRFCKDWRNAVARQIIDNIKDHEAFKVVIDCAEKADWKVTNDHRTQNKFWDLVEAFAILRYKQRYMDADGWLHATVEDFNEAKNIFMKRKANHKTHLTNAQAEIVKAVCKLWTDPDGATQSSIAMKVGRSQQAVSKSLKAIMANTTFIVSYQGAHGETYYKPTISELEVLYTSGEIVTLPDDYQDPYNHDTPSSHPVHTLDTPNQINNNKHNSIENQSKSENIKDSLGSSEDELSKLHRNQKIGCKVVKVSSDSDKHGVNRVYIGCKSENESKEPLNEAGIGPNPLKFALPLKVKFLKPCDQFVGEDLHKPGEIKNYGPFEFGDIATLPKLYAATLIMKGVATEAST